MTPKEKSAELIDKFTYWNTREAEREGIKSALSVVDEILLSHSFALGGIKPSVYKYWNEVKNEIEKYKL